MDVHEGVWPENDHGDMTRAPCDVGVTETQNDQPRRSTSQDQDWAEMISSCFQNSGSQPASGNIDFELFNLGELPAQFGAANDYPEHDPVSATTNSSLSSSVCDPNGAPHPFQMWQPTATHPLTFEQPTAQPFHFASWMPEQQYDQPLHFGMHQHHGGLGIHMPPTSHPVDIPGSMYSSRAFVDHAHPALQHGLRQHGGWDQHERNVPPQDDIFGDDEERDSADSADPCYAQLLYQCLKEAPNYTLSLRELYDWVAQHSQKAKDPKNRGWQNSVRHNLSMNAAFARVPHGVNSGPKKGSLWRLTEDAMREGVISTTRYRKDPKRKPERRATPALNRQASGAKGGRATRDATRLRQQQQNRTMNGMPHPNRIRRPDRPHHAMQYSPYLRSAETSPQPGIIPATPAASPYFIDDPASLPLPLSAPQTPPGQHPMSATPPPAFQMNFENTYRKPAPFSNFEFLPLDYSQGGIFGDQDPEIQQQQQPHTPTPSLMTEASFMTDDNILPPGPMMPCNMLNNGTPFQ